VAHHAGDDDGLAPTKLRARADDEGTATAAAFELRVIEGPEAGTTLAIDGEAPTRVLVGQSPSCALRLTDPLVSRRHAAVLHTNGPELRVVDLDSSNGTFVGAVRIAEAFLRGGEILRLGDTAIRVDLVDLARAFPLSKATHFERVVGASVEMRRLYAVLERVAVSDVPVVIEGETGTGKELLAESLHDRSARAGKPFVVFDCTTVAPSLIESELFGHERGAFTGATGQRKGVFELAHGGTLFIDEIGDLDLALQPKLLRAIQRKEVRRVGGDRWIPIDVRVIAATRRDLDAEVQAERFRDDLFFRLAVARVELPPLRARIGDVAVLARHFWSELGGGESPIPYDLLQRWETYRWPGNVRELYNEIARALALGDLSRAQLRGREPPVSSPVSSSAPSSRAGETDWLQAILELDLPLVRARARALDEFHRRYVERVVAQHGGNVTHAARASGIAHRYFQILRARGTK
jgi:transcriptional regulator with GAF, ATPase, and Fis domain